MRPIIFVLILTFLANLGNAQSVREYIGQCNIGLLNSKFDSSNYESIYVNDKYSYGKTFIFHCTKFKTLYDLPIVKTLFQVTESDTIDAIQIFLPFDSTLVRQLESDLGPPEPTWMAFQPGVIGTSKIIWDRHWFMDKYVISFRCTRYMPLLGETLDDYMIISVSPRVIKR
jgi:hypothetical protein